MDAQHSAGQELVKGTGRLVAHAFALVLGMILMVAAIAMGVTIAMLPIGIPLGFVGLFLFFWGLFGGEEAKQWPAPPPSPK
jgi:uncharacterized membrane protein YccF (DUF307 family)